jgi:hypothetical protein
MAMFQQKYQLKFKHNQQVYIASVCQDSQFAGLTVFKIIINQGKYWVIKNDNEWRFVADFQPCTQIKQALIKSLKTHLLPGKQYA